MDRIGIWLRQPTSVAGLATLVGIAVGLATREIALPQAAPLLAGALASILLPDNSAARQTAERLAGELLTQKSSGAGQ